MPDTDATQSRKPARLLLIEDDPGAGTALQRVMRDEGYEVQLEMTAESGLKRMQASAFELVITDLKLPGMDGLELVKRIRGLNPEVPIILMTAHGTTETAIEAMKRGAMDYVTKPFEVEELLGLVQRGLRQADEQHHAIRIDSAETSPSGMVGKSRAMQALYKEIGRVAALSVTVLIRGETGSGKELVARAIHEHSPRTREPFVAINCAAIPHDLLESELFGHERGAFSGAHQLHRGHFERAGEGTLFLDEIGDLPFDTQAKILRVLQEKTFLRVGGSEPITTSARILAATHRNLESAIQEKEFREDLFYRLSAVTLRVPTLAERPEDIPELSRHFLKQFVTEMGISDPRMNPDTLDHLARLPWPGNVRQLQNTLRQALLLARPFPIAPQHIDQARGHTTFTPSCGAEREADPWLAPIRLLLDQAERGESTDIYWKLIADLERVLFPEAMKRAQGNQSKAAKWLGITRLKLRESTSPPPPTGTDHNK